MVRTRIPVWVLQQARRLQAQEAPSPEKHRLQVGVYTVVIEDFASFDMPPARILNDVTPRTGFRWDRGDGEAYLHAKYRLGPYQGGDRAAWCASRLTCS